MYKSIEHANKLNNNQLVLTRCPDWCDEGYQVARWNGSEFYYDSDPNGTFNEHVIAFLPLDEDGKPCKL